MNKILYILKETGRMIKRNKLFFLGPILIILVIIAVLAYYIGPAVIKSFIYAGI